jgi:23S rRNA (guanosine2251-2'-O)-methyltransferase
MAQHSPKGKHSRHSKRNKQAKSEQTIPDDLMYGLHAIQAALEVTTPRVTEIWLANDREDERTTSIIQLAAQHGIALHKVEREQLDKRLPDVQHQGGIARCKPISQLDEKALYSLIDDLNEPAFLLILDCVQDPHNLGACMRSAEAAGAHAVIAPKDRASSLTATALKVSSGAAERLPFIQVTNLSRVLKDLQQKGVWLVGTSGDCEQSLFEVDLKGPLGLILGAEGKGIRRLTRENCDQVVYIPMKGQAESLNVSVASGVCLFEAARQRGLS